MANTSCDVHTQLIDSTPPGRGPLAGSSLYCIHIHSVRSILIMMSVCYYCYGCSPMHTTPMRSSSLARTIHLRSRATSERDPDYIQQFLAFLLWGGGYSATPTVISLSPTFSLITDGTVEYMKERSGTQPHRLYLLMNDHGVFVK